MDLERRIIHSAEPKKPVVLQERPFDFLQFMADRNGLHIRDRRHSFYGKFPADQPLIISGMNYSLTEAAWVQIMDNEVCAHSPGWLIEFDECNGDSRLRVSDGREYLLPKLRDLYQSGYTMLYNMLERVDVSQSQLNTWLRGSAAISFLGAFVAGHEKWWDASYQAVQPRLMLSHLLDVEMNQHVAKFRASLRL